MHSIFKDDRIKEIKGAVKIKKLTFIHSADLHLDSPMLGLRSLPETIHKRLQDSTFTSLHHIINKAIQYKVDFVLIAGDLFDSEDRSIRAQSRFRDEMFRLQAHQIDAFIIHGNHDHLDGDWVKLALPSNVFIFSSETECKVWRREDLTVHLYGFSYGKRHIYENKMDTYTKKEGADYHIALLHGYEEGGSDHNPYAPFQLKQLIAKKFDYWALGHIHQRKILNEQPPIVYSGNIQGRHKKETDEKGCYLVEMTEQQTELQFLTTVDVIWRKVTKDISHLASIDEFIMFCRTIMKEERCNHKAVLLHLTFEQVQLAEQIYLDEILDILRLNEEQELNFVYITEITLKQKNQYNETLLRESSQFFQTFFSLNKKDIVLDAMKPLYNHPVAHRYVTPLTDEEEQRLLEEAEQLLIDLLLE